MSSVKLLVGGSRYFTDYEYLHKKLDLLTMRFTEVILLHGNAAGADKLSERWAFYWLWTVLRYHLDVTTHGELAVSIRNQEMVNNADRAVFFFNGPSPDMEDCIGRVRKRGIPIKVYEVE